MRGVGDPETLLDGGGGKATVSGCDFSRGPAAPLSVFSRNTVALALPSRGPAGGAAPPLAEPWMQEKQPQQETRRCW